MLSPKDIEVHILNECFCHDEENGLLVWRERPICHFKDIKSQIRWNAKHAGNVAGCLDAKGYRVIKLLSGSHKAHRMIWAMAFHKYPDKFIDHINGEKDDNRLSNLREVDFIANAQNMGIAKNNHSGVSGVWYDSNRGHWRASIVHSGKRISLGVHQNFEDAVLARKSAEHNYGYHPNHGRR